MSLNDPQWGRRDNDGPPDLDELWRRFNQKLNSWFGGRGGRSGGRGPSGARPLGGFGVVAVVIFLIWVASGIYIVDASERGVVLQFGKYKDPIMPPGPHWHIPWPFQSVEIVNVSEVHTVEVGYRNNVRTKVPNESLMLTEDENIVDLQFAVQYIRANPKDYLFNDRHPDETVKQVAEGAIREIVGKSKMDFVLYEGREEIATNARDLMQNVLDYYGTGISVSQVTMQNAQPPEQVQAAFDDAVKANQDLERQKNEGQAYYNDVVPKAEGTSARLMQEAEGYKQRVVAAAEGEASRFDQILAEYKKAPRVTRDRLYLDAMQEVLSNSTKIVIDQKQNSNLLFLPLDKLMQAATAGSETSAAMNGGSAANAATPPPANESRRTREAFRSRDRETR
ncbi:MAG: FtsH protease activity modulator HflK [Burkholderiales bacterium]|nr:FtsH protease activity modulator HflK [Burkholderiales bacterium]